MGVCIEITTKWKGKLTTIPTADPIHTQPMQCYLVAPIERVFASVPNQHHVLIVPLLGNLFFPLERVLVSVFAPFYRTARG